MTVEEHIQRLRVECDNYDRSLSALKALTHELLWDAQQRQSLPDAVAHFGRRMHTSAANRVSPLRKVTPDMVAQKSASQGVVIELKASLPADAAQKRAQIVSVLKYDDVLTGWCDGQPVHDLVLLIDHGNSETGKDELLAAIAAGEFQCDRPFALVYFVHTNRADATWISLHLIHGNLSDAGKTATLRTICHISPEHIESNPKFGRVRLYDANPPLPLLMQRLYEAINSNVTDEESLRLRTEGTITKPLSLAQMKDLLCDYCCPKQTDPRVPNLPETKWLKKAIEKWVAIGWAEKSTAIPNAFDVTIKKSRREPFNQFLKICAEECAKVDRKRERAALLQRQYDEDFKRDHPLIALAAELSRTSIVEDLVPEEAEDGEVQQGSTATAVGQQVTSNPSIPLASDEQVRNAVPNASESAEKAPES